MPPSLESPHSVEADFVPRLANSGPFLPEIWTLEEEFIGGTADEITSADTNANVGELNWNVADSGGGGAVRRQPSTDGMLGWYQIEANGTSRFGIYLGAVPSETAGLRVGSVRSLEWRVTFNGPTPQVEGVGRVGMGQNPSIDQLGEESMWFELNPDLSEFIRIGSASDRNVLVEDTSIRWVEGEVYDCRIVRVSDEGLAFFINRQLVGSRNAATGQPVPPPDMLLAFMAQAEGGHDSITGSLGVDRFRFLRT